MKKIRVFTADDHHIVGAGLNDLLSNYSYIEIVGNSLDMDGLLKNSTRKDIDVYIIDLGFEGTRGDIGVIAKVLSINPKARIVVFTMRGKAPTILGCYRSGALAYVNKSADGDILIEAINSASEGKRYFMPGVLDKIGLSSIDDPLEQLGDREKKIFLLLAQNVDLSEVAKEFNITEKRIYNIITEKIKPVLGVSLKGFRDYAIKLGLIDDF